MRKLLLFLLLVSAAPAMAQYNITTSVTTGCGPLTVDFGFAGNSNGVENLYFEYGDGNSGYGIPTDPYQNVFVNPGHYDVVMYVLDIDGNVLGFNSAGIDVTGAGAAVSSNLIGIGDAVTGSVSGDATSVSWDFGDGSAASTDMAPSHTYATAGTYTITATVQSASCGTQVYTFDVEVSGINFSYSPTVVCAPADVNFTWTGTATGAAGYYWDFGDGQNAFAFLNTPQTHNYASGGTYTVSLTLFDGSFQAIGTISKDVVVNGIGIQANLLATTVGQDITFSAQNVSGSASWDFGDGNTGSGMVVTHSYAAVGNYNVTLSGTSAACGTQTVTQVINIIDLTVNSTPVLSCNAPFQIDFTTTTSLPVAFYYWDFGDGNTAFSATASDTNNLYTQEGMYTTYLELYDGNFQVIGTALYDVAVGLFIDASNPVPAVGEQVDFTQYGDISSITWDFGDGSPTSNSLNPSHTYTAMGTYTVTATIVSPSCGTVTRTVVINILDVSFTFNQTSVCASGDVTIAYTGTEPSVAFFNIAFGDGSTDYFGPNTSTVHSYTGSGVYTIEVVAFDVNFNALGYDTYDVTIHGLPVVSAGNDTTICVYHIVTLSGSGNAISYTWDNGVTDGVGFVPGATGVVTYTVTGTDGNGCTASDQITMTYDPCVGVNENNQEIEFNLYPNPATATVSVKAGEKATQLEVLNLAGQTLMSQQISGQKQLNVSQFASGTYLVRVLDAHAQVLRTERLVIE